MRDLKKDLETCQSSDADFIAKAREGCPEAIKRAVEAEEENTRLKTELTATRSRLIDTKKALYLACKSKNTHCPADLKTGDEGVCKELECDDDTAKCWKEYFLLKARAKHD